MQTGSPAESPVATLRDDDSAIHLQRDGDDAVAIWAEDDAHPGVTLAYTFATEAAFREALQSIGYRVTHESDAH